MPNMADPVDNNAPTDADLLRRFARGGGDGDDAFAQLVRRHAAWVLAVARRRVGNHELAEDVAQAAFIVLAQKGKRLPATTPLAPWLFRVTCFAASRASRDESRRRRHEVGAAMTRDARTAEAQIAAWEQLAPALDRAVEGLRSADRHAVLLRFYQRRSLAEVGVSLGISEEAARKRVSRAIDTLRGRLASLGVRAADVAPAALAAMLLEHAADASAAITALAPRWATVSVAAQTTSSAAAAASATSNELAQGAMKMILWNNTKAAVAAVLAVAVVIGGVSAVVHAVVAQRPPQTRSVAVPANAAVAPAPAAVTMIQSQSLVLAVSPDRTSLAGFAMATGEWQPLPDPPATIDSNRIVVAENVGAYRDTKRVYGFSGITGKWGSAALSAGAGGDAKDGVNVAQNVAVYVEGNRVHAFSALTGTWDTLTLPASASGAGAEPPQPTLTAIMVTVHHEKSLYLFSAKTGKWTEPPFQRRE